MENILKIGKYSLIAVVWLFIILTYNHSLDVSVLIKFSIGLCYAALIVGVGFWIFNVTENFKSSIVFIIKYLSLALILYIGYSVAEESFDLQTGLVIEGSKFTEGSIYGLYAVTVIAIIVIFVSEVKRLMKI